MSWNINTKYKSAVIKVVRYSCDEANCYLSIAIFYDSMNTM